ncbi:MAG: hypothetical protein ABGY10_10150 [bacterium]
MKKLSFFALLVIALIPLRSQAQRNPIEIGFDASLIRSVIEANVPGNAGRTSLAIPAPSVRFGIFLSDLVSLETDISHQYASSEDQTHHSFSMGTGIQYHMAPPTRSSTFFMGVGTRVNSRGQATGNAKREFEDERDKDKNLDRDRRPPTPPTRDPRPTRDDEKNEWDEDDRYLERRSPNDTQFGVSGEIGYKVRIDDRLGLRASGFFYHDFRSSGRAAKSSLGVGFGFSFFTGGTRREERSRRR